MNFLKHIHKSFRLSKLQEKILRKLQEMAGEKGREAILQANKPELEGSMHVHPGRNLIVSGLSSYERREIRD